MKKQWFLLLAVVAFLFISVTSLRAEAASSQTGDISGWGSTSKNFYVDFDGDGSSDVLRIAASCNSNSCITQVRITLDNRLIGSMTGDGTDSFSSLKVVLFRMSGSKYHLYLNREVINGYVGSASIYTYDTRSKKLKTEATLSAFRNGYVNKTNQSFLMFSKVTNNSIQFQSMFQPCEIGAVSFDTTMVYKNGKFVLQKSTFKPSRISGHKGATYKAARKLTFYKTAGGKSKAFTLSKGEKATLRQLCMKKTGFFAQFQKGSKKGWLRIGHSFQSLHMTNTSSGYKGYFYGIMLAG